MNHMELSVPIRLYWDVDPDVAEPMPWEAVCRDIIGLRILSLNLTDLSSGVSETSLGILRALSDRGPAVTLTAALEACTPPVAEQLAGSGVRTLLLRLRSLGDLDQVSSLGNSGPIALGVSWEMTAASWRDLPAVIAWCHARGIRAVTIPMQRLWLGEKPFFLHPEEKIELASQLRTLPMVDPPKLTIHDPFLWRVVFPTVPFPDGGCQGGNTMMAIAPDGSVYPCPSLPSSMGNLSEASLAEVIAGTRKKDTRGEILRCPAPCEHCADYATCRGGCRGRALAFCGSLDAADPGCLC